MQVELDIGIRPQRAMRRGETLGSRLCLSRYVRPLTIPPLCIP
jgi:hypothetical protein